MNKQKKTKAEAEAPKLYEWYYEIKTDFIFVTKKINDIVYFRSFNTNKYLVLEIYHGRECLRFKNEDKRIIINRQKFIKCNIIF